MATTPKSGLQKLQARGTSMRNDTAMTARSQHPENKDPSGVTPGPEWQQNGGKDAPNHAPIRLALPKGLESDAHRTGKKVMHLAEGHHVKNEDGSTSFHMHALDGEPVNASHVQSSPEDQEEAQESTGAQSSPYGVSEALRGFSM